MWTSRISFAELTARDRWKVEFFSNAELLDRNSAYPRVPLGDLVVQRKESVSPRDFPEKMFDFLGLENVEPRTGDLVGDTQKMGGEIRSRSKVFRRDDVLYGRLRPYLNKVYCARDEVSEGVCSGEFYVLVPQKERILPLFLRTLLASSWVQRVVADWQTGSALPRLSLRDLLSLRLPVPPLERQLELVAFIAAEDEKRRELMSVVQAMPDKLFQAFEECLSSGDAMKKLR